VIFLNLFLLLLFWRYIVTFTEVLTVRKCGPQNDHVERSDLAKRFFIVGWERERAESQEREGERGRGLNTPQ
jgi:hypothetical protein